MSAKNRSKYYSVTVRGINLKIAKDAFDDMDTVELFGDVQDGDIFAFPRLVKRIFGDKEYPRIKDALANADGKTTVLEMSNFLTEVMTACNALAAKN